MYFKIRFEKKELECIVEFNFNLVVIAALISRLNYWCNFYHDSYETLHSEFNLCPQINDLNQIPNY